MTCSQCTTLREREENPEDAAPCMRHRAEQNGWRCESCGSPWVYIRAAGSHYEDGKERFLCKPCLTTLIRTKGLDRDIDYGE